MDMPLRNGLWNVLKAYVWDNGPRYGKLNEQTTENDTLTLCVRLWAHFFKEPLEAVDDYWTNVLASLRKRFVSFQWFEVYDFVEFVANNYADENFRKRFIAACNNVLEREMSAYRFVGNTISQITEKQEIETIDLALSAAKDPIRIHLQPSLEMLSARENPDYRNSIKESISAVESLVAITFGEKGTLGQLLKKLEGKIHPALIKAFSNLYGYTSDDGGIRHALMDAESITFQDAKFFLVVCSAFVNFVESKAP